MNEDKSVWIFNGIKAHFPSGVFDDFTKAEAWIAKHKLTGILTKYPINVGAYDWAISAQLFMPEKPQHSDPNFIGSFSSASFEHGHYEDGRRCG